VTSLVDAYGQIEFEFTLDEAVALQADFVKTAREGRSWRKREQRNFVVAMIAVAAAFVVWNSSGDLVHLATVLSAITLLALVLAIPFGWYYDHSVRTRTARLLAERMGPGPYRCSIRIHPDALRVAQTGLELVFPWSSAVGTDDVADGVLVTFTTGLVLARSRGFTSQEHRQHFLRRVRELSATGTANELSCT
jgi:hypothetical protein